MNIGYILKESFSGFRRAKLSSAVSVFTIAVSLVLLGIFALLTLNLLGILTGIRNRVEIEVYLSDITTAKEATDLLGDLTANPAVRGAQYISKDSAAVIFEKEFGENIKQVLGTNPLPHSIKVSFKTDYSNLDSLKQFIAAVKEQKGVTDARYNVEFLENIDRNARLFTYITAGIGIVISLASVALVSNTIRLAIYAKRDLIKTMKLVGATFRFIRLPFLIEGFLQGLLGGLFAAALIYAVIEGVLRGAYREIYESMSLPGLPFYAAVIAVGSGLGFIGSFFSVRRFISEKV